MYHLSLLVHHLVVLSDAFFGVLGVECGRIAVARLIWQVDKGEALDLDPIVLRVIKDPQSSSDGMHVLALDL
jgi:hypothetical protein